MLDDRRDWDSEARRGGDGSEGTDTLCPEHERRRVHKRSDDNGVVGQGACRLGDGKCRADNELYDLRTIFSGLGSGRKTRVGVITGLTISERFARCAGNFSGILGSHR